MLERKWRSQHLKRRRYKKRHSKIKVTYHKGQKWSTRDRSYRVQIIEKGHVMGTMTKREIISQKEEKNGGQQPSICFKSLLPKEFGSRRPQLKDAADQTFSLIKWGRSRWQVKFTEYIQSSSERKNRSKLQVPCPQNPSVTGWSLLSHCVWFCPLHWSQRARKQELRPRVYNGGASFCARGAHGCQVCSHLGSLPGH